MLIATTAILVLVFRSSNDTGKAEVWAAAGAALGIFLFIRGFIMLRYKRLILNTPSSKVRSAAMGLVEITGMAKGPVTIPAGITGSDCYYYRAEAWQLRQSGRNSQWKRVACESLYVPFFVEDPTGKLLIDPQGADLDLPRDFKDEFSTSFFSSNRDMLPENVAQFLARNGVSFDARTRLEEYCIKPDSPLFVLGTFGTSAGKHLWEAGVHVASGSTHGARLNLFGSMGGGALQALASVSGSEAGPSNAGISASFVSTAPSKPVRPAAAPAAASSWASVSMDDVGSNRRVAPAPSASSGQDSPPRTSPQPSQSRVATPVAEMDPDPAAEDSSSNSPDDGFNLHPMVCVSKGPAKDPFMISWRSQREVVQALAWKSALCIWGGPALTLACLYFLAATLGWT